MPSVPPAAVSVEETRPSMTIAELRARWFEQSTGTGWLFSTDWHDPAIDAVCEACVRAENVWPAAERLGAARAAAGASLGETLADVDGLTAVLPDLPTELLYRAVSLGWADHSGAPAADVLDPLTGLVSIDYLRVRMGELYRAADVDGRCVSDAYALVTVRLDLAGRVGWDRVTPMILAGDALRTVFDGEQTLARLSRRAAVALTRREPLLPRRVQLLSGLLAERLIRDARSVPPPAPPRVWIEQLPHAHHAACDLVGELGR